MESAQKAIMIGVGLFITIIIIAAVMTITGIGQDLLNQGQGQLVGISSQLQTQLQSQYDQVTLTGTLVRSSITNLYGNDNLVIRVYNNTGNYTDMLHYGAVNFTQAAVIQPAGGPRMQVNGILVVDPTLAATTPSRATIGSINTNIQTQYRYKSVLIRRDDTGEVIGVAFIRYQ